MPVVFNQHYIGTIGYWYRAVTDGLARTREVIRFNNAGFLSSSGEDRSASWRWAPMSSRSSRLMQSDMVRGFVAEFHTALEDKRNAAMADGAKAETKRERITGRIERLTDLITDGVERYEEMKGRLVRALAERTAIDRDLEDAEAIPAIAVHLGIVDAYRRNITDLATADRGFASTPPPEGLHRMPTRRSIVP